MKSFNFLSRTVDTDNILFENPNINAMIQLITAMKLKVLIPLALLIILVKNSRILPDLGFGCLKMHLNDPFRIFQNPRNGKR